jgi:low temperature requirement protein LtrA
MTETAPPTPISRAHRLIRMTGRDTTERHRASTPLELLFDLTFVVGFSFASSELAEAIVAGDVGLGLIGFVVAMFAICWAWINFAWFASAFDTDDWLYRVVTMVQMVGVLILALGIPPLFDSLEHSEHVNITTIVIGYVVMRLAMVFQWLRAATQGGTYRRAALTYVMAIVIAQLGWVTVIFLNLSVLQLLICIVVLDVVEGVGPAIAERRPTPWHAEHIADRYAALAIIALGEGVVGTAAALSAVLDAAGGWSWQVALVGLAGIGLTLSMWWTYFTLPSGEALELVGNSKSFVWGYGQILVFAGIAATGAGLHVAALQMEHQAHAVATESGAAAPQLSVTGAVLAVAVPVAVFTAALYALYTYLVGEFDRLHVLLLAGTALLLALPVVLAAAGTPLPVCLLVLAAAPAVSVIGYEWAGHAHQGQILQRLRERTRPGGSGPDNRPVAARTPSAPR